MAHRLDPPEATEALDPAEVVRRLRVEFLHVEADVSAGAEAIAAMMAKGTFLYLVMAKGTFLYLVIDGATHDGKGDIPLSLDWRGNPGKRELYQSLQRSRPAATVSGRIAGRTGRSDR
jgi:hypothetical protein